MSWKKQKVKREEKMNIKMQELTIENKELKKMIVEWTGIHNARNQRRHKKHGMKQSMRIKRH